MKKLRDCSDQELFEELMRRNDILMRKDQGWKSTIFRVSDPLNRFVTCRGAELFFEFDDEGLLNEFGVTPDAS